MLVRLITHTTGVEGTEYYSKTLDEIIVAKARLSSSREINDKFKEPYKLLRYCITNGHWSIFDMCNMTFEVTTSRDIGRQIIRHSSIKPQEFSQRYAVVNTFEPLELRLESVKNRQSSEEVADPLIDTSYMGQKSDDSDMMYPAVATHAPASFIAHNSISTAFEAYELLIKNGISKETARFILPGLATTTFCLNGSIRSWITFLNLRLEKNTQKEHREIAKKCAEVFIKYLPETSKALFNFEHSDIVHILDQVCLHKYGVRNEILSKKLIEEN